MTRTLAKSNTRFAWLKEERNSQTCSLTELMYNLSDINLVLKFAKFWMESFNLIQSKNQALNGESEKGLARGRRGRLQLQAQLEMEIPCVRGKGKKKTVERMMTPWVSVKKTNPSTLNSRPHAVLVSTGSEWTEWDCFLALSSRSKKKGEEGLTFYMN